MTGEAMESIMKKRVSISLDLADNCCYDSLALRLNQLGAVLVLPTQWFLLTSLTVSEVTKDLQAYIDPADRLLVTQVSSMSFRNLINNDKFGSSAA